MPAAAVSPLQPSIMLQKLVKPLGHAQQGSGSGSSTPLSCFDAVTLLTAVSRAWGFQEYSIDEEALEAAVEATVTDLPWLAGRMSKLEGMRLGSACIQHTGEGVQFTVAEAPALSLSASMAPDSWPASGITLYAPELPFYVERLNVGKSMLAGETPLMAVRLTRLADGDVLGLTLLHPIADATRWPALVAHLSARYRQCAGGLPPDPAHLMCPADRLLLSSQHMAQELLGEGAAAWKPPHSRIRGSLAGYWRLGCMAFHDMRERKELVLLHLPHSCVAALKQQAAAEGTPGAPVSTGDAVQAAAALLMHWARDLPLLPVAPQEMGVLVQATVPKGYFGNAMRMLRISLPAGTAQPAAGDHSGALRQLAGAIRRATGAFRSKPELVLEAIAEMEALAGAPAPRMLAFLATDRLAQNSCTTNYVPRQPSPDLGLGREAVYEREMTQPLGRNMLVIRAAPEVPPYGGGLLLQFCLPAQHAARLAATPLLAGLMPGARVLGGKPGC